MASLERINIYPMYLDSYSVNKEIDWLSIDDGKSLNAVPHIFFSDGSPWLEANSYAIYSVNNGNAQNTKTALSNLSHIKAYADWLESTGTDWRNFPRRKSERCLYIYRGYLIQQRNNRIISPSTAKARMGAVLRFYRWIKLNNLIDDVQMWTDKIKSVRYFDSAGFSRTMNVATSELSIPNKKTTSEFALEDGLLPINDINKKTLLNFLRESEMIELYLITKIGFLTGARSETIRTLRTENIENAIHDPLSNLIKRVAVGPGTRVLTKGRVIGNLIFPSILIEELTEYANSTRRLLRAMRAPKAKQTLLFVTQRGNGYSENSFTKLISSLRKQLIKSGKREFNSFKFHQTRATFGTTLMKIASKVFPDKTDAIKFVKEAMLHKYESTTWKYLKFIETTPVKEALADEFFELFKGHHANPQELINQVTYSALH